jgi:hypothetical protein
MPKETWATRLRDIQSDLDELRRDLLDRAPEDNTVHKTAARHLVTAQDEVKHAFDLMKKKEVVGGS